MSNKQLSNPSPVYWQCVTPNEFLWAHWEEESLLFDRRSGQTHTLTPLATEVIFLLAKQALTSNSVTDQLNTLFPELNGAVTQFDINNLLIHFDSLGLIKECAPTQ